VDVFLGSGYTKEEWKVINETRKIMHEPSCRSQQRAFACPYTWATQAVHAEFTKAITRSATEIVHEAPGITVQDEPSVNVYPTWSVAGRDDTYVGRIRQTLRWARWDRLLARQRQLRKGAALNAIRSRKNWSHAGWSGLQPDPRNIDLA
jgi:aspartate-semialdehyde dehydrogenase